MLLMGRCYHDPMMLMCGERSEAVMRSYTLPVLAGILVVFSFPPFGLWYLGFFALVPFIVFVFAAHSIRRAFIGGVLFGLSSNYLAASTLPAFGWLPQAYLLQDLVHALPFVILAVAAIGWGVMAAFAAYVARCYPALRVGMFIMLLLASEWIWSHAFVGFDYLSFAYIGVHAPLVRAVAAYGGAFLVAALVLLANFILAELVFFACTAKRVSRAAVVTAVACLVLLVAAHEQPAPGTATLSVAIIQAQSMLNERSFGENGPHDSFQFPKLASLLHEAAAAHPNVVVYPTSPWPGFLTDNPGAVVPTGVATTSRDAFAAWERTVLPGDTVLVTWGIVARDGAYVDEIMFWQDGVLLGVYGKQVPFPFLDYTPTWAERAGFYTTPFNITASASQPPVRIGDVAATGLVCSEVTLSAVARQNAAHADLIFAIGTEIVFSGSVAESFNLLNTELRAAETKTPVIRANIVGPSAVIDETGTVTSALPYGEEGILFSTVRITSNRSL